MCSANLANTEQWGGAHSVILRDHMRCWGLKPGWPQARKAHHLLYYLSGPYTNICNTVPKIKGPVENIFKIMKLFV